MCLSDLHNEVVPFCGDSFAIDPQSTTCHELSSTQKIDVSFLKEPGVYEILDVQNDRSYYRETAFLLDRFQIHWRQLRNGTHSCKGLLEAF